MLKNLNESERFVDCLLFEQNKTSCKLLNEVYRLRLKLTKVITSVLDRELQIDPKKTKE